MTKLVLTLAAATLAAGALAVPHVAQAGQATQTGTLLVQRVQHEKHMHLPTRGMSKQAVKHEFGAPLRKLPQRGGDTPLHPVIYRWEYAKYIVYFEYDHVIHTVLNTPAGNNRHPKQTQ